jgi:eukaryotic-like serine/threonine-protein kinase
MATLESGESTGGDVVSDELPSSHWTSPGFADRYATGDVLGTGGMGEVRTARDRLVGRDVAIKRLRSPAPTPEQIARFLREARVQGRLEHPAVVPIHDVGLDAAGLPFLVMKRVDGVTLASVLARGDADRWPRRALLGAFAQICLAVDFAHSRGVIHRDLKPANILLGSFGEVYVLDWGVARIAGHADVPADGDVTAPALDTVAGSIVGTPSYMAPEQRMGAADIDHRVDVYALGCVLFEILTGARHGLAVADTITSAPTLATGAAPGPERIPAIPAEAPPELTALWQRATAADREARPPSARALHDEIQRYLDGDRDLARRRALASEHVASAERALADLTRRDDAATRAAAMREAGRALALDPSSATAAAITSRLMLEPPAHEPPAVGAAIDRERQSLMRAQARSAWRMYAVYLACVPLLGLIGARSLAYPLALAGVMVAQLAAISIALRREPLPERWIYGSLFGDLVALVLLTRIAGPLLLVPAQITGMVGLYVRHSGTRHPALIAAALLATVVVPLGLELVGVLPASYQFVDGVMLVRSDVATLTPVATYAVLLVLLAANVFGQAGLSATTRREHAAATRQLHVQAWHLAQLVRPTGPGSGDHASGGGSASMRSSSPLRSRA